MPGALSLLGGDRAAFRLAVVLQMTNPGIPTVYYGEEVGRPGGDWPDNRSDMPWGDRPIAPGAGLPRDEAMRDDYRRLIALRRAHPALRTGTHRALLTDGDLLVFAREGEGDTVVVAVNRGAAPAAARVATPAAFVGRAVRDAWAGAPLESSAAETLAFEVGPRSAAILVATPAAGEEGGPDG